MRYLLIIFLCFGMMGCRTTGKHWLLNKETGELELVEVIKTEGTGKHKIKFQTGGETDSDSGFKIPEINLPKMEFE